MSWVPIVHVPHGPSHAGETQPGGPGVIIIAPLAASHTHSGGEEDCADKVEGDEDEDHSEHCAEVNTGQGAGHSPLKPPEQGGYDRV